MPDRHRDASLRLYALPDAADLNARLDRAAALGFSHVLIRAAGDLAATGTACRARGLGLLLDFAPHQLPADSEAARRHPEWRAPSPASGIVDPRRDDFAQAATVMPLHWHDDSIAETLLGWWTEVLRAHLAAGACGVRCVAPARLPAPCWRRLIAAAPEANFLAWTPGLTPDEVLALQGCGFAGVFSSLPWWDYRADWFVAEHRRLRAIAPVWTMPAVPCEASFDAPRADTHARLRALQAAAALGDGWLVPAGFEQGLEQEVKHANRRLPANAVTTHATLQPLTGPDAAMTAIAHHANGSTTVIAINPSLDAPATLGVDRLVAALRCAPGHLQPADSETGTLGPDATLTLRSGAVARFYPTALAPVLAPTKRNAMKTLIANAPRIAIERISPQCDAGRFAVKRIVGERVRVEADVWMDGHDTLAVALCWRPADGVDWHEVRMAPLGNDRWAASFPLERMGRYEYTVLAWLDRYGSWVDEVQKKRAAGADVTVETQEGVLLVTRTAAQRQTGDKLRTLAAALEQAAQDPLALLLDPATQETMRLADTRPFAVRHEPALPLEAERLAARFASWYELFPRSEGNVPGQPLRHGTFDDVIARLPAIRQMGFDTLYFPPIHPIGTTKRKGRNNTLSAAPDDPGSPYAIGAEDGGHDAVHAQLGTPEDFRKLVSAAADHGMEIALDFAIQCSLDHPWLRAHPEWFAFRADGTLRYAENPPKKYEDIVNVDFYARPDEAAAALWQALRDVVLFWVAQGVKLFRVDNPHTKPMPFWEWLIADVRGRHPDVIFLSEAFTRPKVMARLAKLGFSQSYTYFTWRNDKREMTEYLTELTQTPLRDYFRPHFFVNTPDINPYFLQGSGRPGFLIRAALATLLSGLWGMYNGFELCEAAALPGKEEYADSEKYELRARDWRQPGNIVDVITQLNAIRLANPALQTHLGLEFFHAFNDQVMLFAKATPGDDGQFGDNVILAAISFDPVRAQEANIELPLWRWGLPDHAALHATDLMQGHQFTWHGKVQRIRLDPHVLPFAVWRVRPANGANDA